MKEGILDLTSLFLFWFMCSSMDSFATPIRHPSGDAHINVQNIANALQQYALDHHRFPPSLPVYPYGLQSLTTPHPYIPVIPWDPFTVYQDATAIQYVRELSKAVLVYTFVGFLFFFPFLNVYFLFVKKRVSHLFSLFFCIGFIILLEGNRFFEILRYYGMYQFWHVSLRLQPECEPFYWEKPYFYYTYDDTHCLLMHRGADFYYQTHLDDIRSAKPNDIIEGIMTGERPGIVQYNASNGLVSKGDIIYVIHFSAINKNPEFFVNSPETFELRFW